MLVENKENFVLWQTLIAKNEHLKQDSCFHVLPSLTPYLLSWYEIMYWWRVSVVNMAAFFCYISREINQNICNTEWRGINCLCEDQCRNWEFAWTKGDNTFMKLSRNYTNVFVLLLV